MTRQEGDWRTVPRRHVITKANRHDSGGWATQSNQRKPQTPKNVKSSKGNTVQRGTGDQPPLVGVPISFYRTTYWVSPWAA